MSAQLVIATALGRQGGGLATTAAVATAMTGLRPELPITVVDLCAQRQAGSTLFCSVSARQGERRLRQQGYPARARGRLCWLPMPGEDDDRDPVLDHLIDLVEAVESGPLIAWLPPSSWASVVASSEIYPRATLVAVDPGRRSALLPLVVGELDERDLPAMLIPATIGPVGARRALAGIPPGGPAGRRSRRLAERLCDHLGQALPLMMGICVIAVFLALALVALAGSVSGVARLQAAADLSALSAARSMRDDISGPAGSGDLFYTVDSALGKRRYLERARRAGIEAAAANGVSARRLRITFPDEESPLPLRARVEVLGSLVGSEATPSEDFEIEVTAEATASPPVDYTGMPASASGGGYDGPLAYRQGRPMRPEVAAAFDEMARAAAASGTSLLVVSGFRPDAEQAQLFARNPDPRWVAPPGRSLHRNGTELDLGPAGAYGWLAVNAGRFGFVKRYSWEPWHFGFVGLAGSHPRVGDGDGSLPGALPKFVPSRFRRPLERVAARRNVSVGLLAAQLLAESNFNPTAVSQAGARGIAQFMPATAAAYGLTDPFDPVASIDAQARLMSDLLAHFGSIPLALAAYNAGPAPVEGCRCVPPYAETRAYVARILALLDGAGEVQAPRLEVRLVG